MAKICCTHCQARYTLTDEALRRNQGQEMPCQKCGQVFVVAGFEVEEVPPVPPPPPVRELPAASSRPVSVTVPNRDSALLLVKQLHGVAASTRVVAWAVVAIGVVTIVGGVVAYDDLGPPAILGGIGFIITGACLFPRAMLWQVQAELLFIQVSSESLLAKIARRER